MADEPLDLVVVRRADGRKFAARRVYADPDDHRELITYLRDIARAEDSDVSGGAELSHYEMQVSPAGSDRLLFVVGARQEAA